MNASRLLPWVLSLALLGLSGRCLASDALAAVELWPKGAPAEQGGLPEEKDTTKASDGKVAGRSVIRLGNVSKPTLTVYQPAAGQATGTAVLVCPGGAYNILALDLEGTEVCSWLNSLGVTAVLLKYRVPRRAGLEKHAAPLQDAERALGLIRSRAREWGLNPGRIGVLGFSAGGHLAAALSNAQTQRSYEPVDEADRVSCRPDFTVLIYPAYLTVKEEGDKMAPELKISTNTPPAFVAMSQDDPVRVENAVFYALALKKVSVPCELHLYPSGGHGYGLRESKHLVTTWPARAEEWMRSRDLLSRRPGAQ
jgi:acetyl esterase/lipase